jgi:tRNA(adenine34) deaminase
MVSAVYPNVLPGRSRFGDIRARAITMADVSSEVDDRMMAAALAEAERCPTWGDVPIGAVVARGEEVLGAAGNERERRGDPTAHAEILALRQASERVGRWRLDGCTIYVTLEPCAMCSGAMVLARVDRLVFGAPDPKAGFAGSLGDLVRDPRLNHRLEVASGVRAEEAAALLKQFFARRRSNPAL